MKKIKENSSKTHPTNINLSTCAIENYHSDMGQLAIKSAPSLAYHVILPSTR